MLMYLLFIFTCGWCVCWLLFLNYQQYERDKITSSRLKDQNEECEQQGEDSSEKLESNERRIFARRKYLCRLRQRLRLAASSLRNRDGMGKLQEVLESKQLESLVDISGNHTLLIDGEDADELQQALDHEQRQPRRLFAIDDLELDLDEDLDELLDVDELDALLTAEAGVSSQTNLSSSQTREASKAHLIQVDHCDQCRCNHLNDHNHLSCSQLPEMRGWPEELNELIGVDGDTIDADRQADCEETLWPIVELHENPFNSLDSDHPLTGQVDDDDDDGTINFLGDSMLDIESGGRLQEKRREGELLDAGSEELASVGDVYINNKRRGPTCESFQGDESNNIEARPAAAATSTTTTSLSSSTIELAEAQFESRASRVLDRSRLLSLRESQLRNRAAVRLVSIGSCFYML